MRIIEEGTNLRIFKYAEKRSACFFEADSGDLIIHLDTDDHKRVKIFHLPTGRIGYWKWEGHFLELTKEIAT